MLILVFGLPAVRMWTELQTFRRLHATSPLKVDVSRAENKKVVLCCRPSTQSRVGLSLEPG
jgi:hypothetical protein